MSLTTLLTVYLWLKHVNKDTFIDKKLIHPTDTRHTTFAYGNLSAPTLRQVGRLLHSPTTLARSSHFPMLDIQALLTLKLGSIFWRTWAWRAQVLFTRDLFYGTLRYMFLKIENYCLKIFVKIRVDKKIYKNMWNVV